VAVNGVSSLSTLNMRKGDPSSSWARRTAVSRSGTAGADDDLRETGYLRRSQWVTMLVSWVIRDSIIPQFSFFFGWEFGSLGVWMNASMVVPSNEKRWCALTVIWVLQNGAKGSGCLSHQDLRHLWLLAVGDPT
jgi:hypothetical protein